VEVFINIECYCGPYIELAKMKTLPRVYNGNMVTVLKNILEDVIQCAIDRKTVFGFLKPGKTFVFFFCFCPLTKRNEKRKNGDTVFVERELRKLKASQVYSN